MDSESLKTRKRQGMMCDRGLSASCQFQVLREMLSYQAGKVDARAEAGASLVTTQHDLDPDPDRDIDRL